MLTIQVFEQIEIPVKGKIYKIRITDTNRDKWNLILRMINSNHFREFIKDEFLLITHAKEYIQDLFDIDGEEAEQIIRYLRINFL